MALACKDIEARPGQEMIDAGPVIQWEDLQVNLLET
jgi:hypothetical protein